MNHLLKLLLVAFLVGCSSLKTFRLLEEGSIEETFISDSLMFDYKSGIIVVNVKINGEAVDLIFDTGAPNVISKSLVDRLKLSSISSVDATDIHNKSEQLNIVRLDTVTVGNTNFLNTTATVADFDEAPFSCLGIDGLIGSNLMRHAIWDFDFQKQLIKFSSIPPKLDSVKRVFTSKIFVGAAANPSITTKFNGIKILNNTVDLGSNGGIDISKEYYEKAKKKGQLDVVNQFKGASSYGLYGRGDLTTTSYLVNANNFVLGDLETEGQPVNIGGSGNRIGLEFWGNYRLILNWFDKELKLIPVNTPMEEDSEIGFNPAWDDNSLYVSQIKLGTIADKDGLQIGDKILFIDSKDYSFVSKEEWCRIVTGDLKLIDTASSIMKVESNSGEVKNIRIR